MNREQQRVFDLLKEFDGFCRSNDITYCLSGETLLHAVVSGGMEPKPYCASVLMKGADCLRFIRAFEESAPAGRELEYWGNSPDYPDYTLRYVAADSTAFSPYDCLNFTTHGMFIDIQVLKGGKRDNDRRKRIALERGIELTSLSQSGLRPKNQGRTDKVAAAWYKAARLLNGKQKIRKDLFSYYAERCSGPMPQGKEGPVYAFSNRGRKSGQIPADHFSDLSECVVEGTAFPAPRDAAGLLQKLYGDRLSADGESLAITLPPPAYTGSWMICADVPYAEVYGKAGITKADVEELCRHERAIAGIMAANRKNAELAKNDWLTVKQIEAEIKANKHTG